MEFIYLDGEKWRFRGRRANVFDAIAGMQDRGDKPELLAKELELPVVEAILEALDFVEKHPDLRQAHQQRMLKYANEHTIRR